mgnify:CR=1 FL=1
MSPAKRLSRKRFRALCERCHRFGTQLPMSRREMRRVHRFMMSDARASMFALARLARPKFTPKQTPGLVLWWKDGKNMLGKLWMEVRREISKQK